jgi:dsDNA-binding SOS-regulon protein
MEPAATPFAGITPEELETLHSLMTDQDIARVGANLGRDVLWICDDFAEKLGFYKKAHALRFAKQKKLVKYSLPFKQVKGVEEIDGMAVMNPIPKDAAVHSMGHTVVSFMETWPLLQWLTLAPTELAERVRNVLWRVFFARNNDHLRQQLEDAKKDLEEAEKKVEQAKKQAEEAKKSAACKVGVCVVYVCKLDDVILLSANQKL